MQARPIMADIRSTQAACPTCGAALARPEAPCAACVPETGGDRRPFVGRSRELERARQAVDDAIGGRSRLLLVSGDPGIGKTRLAERAGDYARSLGARVALGRCSHPAEGAPSFWPWNQVLRGLREDSGHGDEPPRRGERNSLLSMIGVWPDPATDRFDARFRVFDAVRSLLQRRARDQPLVLVLDDLHWADQPSLALLRFLAGGMSASSILLLGTYRDLEVYDGNPLAQVLPALRREPHGERLALRGLPEGDVERLLVALGGSNLSPAFVREIAEETDGNPLFVEEVVQTLLEDGSLGGESGRWSARGIPANLRLPETVLEAIDRRLRQLPDECRSLLTIASVIGREVDRALLRRVSGLDPEVERETLATALAAGVLRPARHSRHALEFSHALVREALYDELAPDDRGRLHARIAATIEARDAGLAEPHLAEIARHYLEAAHAGYAPQAVELATRAGDRSLEQLAYEEAAEYFGRALEALDFYDQPDEARRCRLLLRLGDAQRRAGALGHSKDTFRRAARIAERMQLAGELADAALGAGGRYAAFEGGLYDRDLVALLERALGGLGRDETPLRARVTGRLAAALSFSERRAEISGLAGDAVALARRSGDPAALAEVLNATHCATWSPDNLEARLRTIAEIVLLADRTGESWLACEAVGWSFYHCLEAEDVHGATRALAALGERTAALRQPFVSWSFAVHRSVLDLLHGRLTDAEASIQEAVEIGERSQNRNAFVVYGTQLAVLRSAQGRLDETRRLAEIAKGIAEQYPTVPAHRCAVAALCACLGEADEARRQIDRLALVNLESLPRDPYWLGAVASLGETAWLLRDPSLAKTVYEAALPFAGRAAVLPFLLAAGSMARPLALTAAVLGRGDDAERLLRQAVEANRRMGARPWLVYAQLELAEVLAERGRPGDVAEAREILGSLVDTASELGIGTERGRDLLSRLEGAPRESPPPAEGSEAVFADEGEYWRLEYAGQSIFMKVSKGLVYLQRLLAEPERDFHSLDLAAETFEPGADELVRMSSPGAEGLEVRGPGGGDEALDAAARRAYRERVEDLEEEIREAESFHDTGRAARARAERDALVAELGRAYGLGGRARREGSIAERARKAVTSRLRDTIERIGKQNPALGRHLEASVRTGTFCSYRPGTPLRWRT